VSCLDSALAPSNDSLTLSSLAPVSPVPHPSSNSLIALSPNAQTAARSFLTRLSSSKIAFDIFHGDLHKRYWKYPFQVWGDVRNKRF
jgi:hypothetical protein